MRLLVSGFMSFVVTALVFYYWLQTMSMHMIGMLSIGLFLMAVLIGGLVGVLLAPVRFPATEIMEGLYFGAFCGILGGAFSFVTLVTLHMLV